MKKKIMVLSLFFIVFLAPLGAAWLMLKNGSPVRLNHHGELISPVQPVLSDNGKWRLVFVCQENCQDAFKNMQAIHQALGKNAQRFEPLIDHTLSMPDNTFYLVDPKGNAMMRYAVNTPPGDILKDIKRLLRSSC